MKTDQLLEMIRLLVASGHITVDDLTPIVKKGISNYMGTPEDEAFKG